ncbi:hypothetical protein [Candidatus Anaplasma sp. TIGMIC]|uniref:hypothetical protein n=1 Tax=Candidatus Anaplasma sp. TIGMIC TaxID=3020713 RepID=UPI00232D3996|nr:hypothetical protein [Candidatus Anaplasma sp. TIGMIC]MDB1135263.1 hypothetical protein [Candidatus Anaplasma sp. TIGMIC]
MSADKIIGVGALISFSKRCLMGIVSGMVVACMLVAAFAKLSELLDVGPAQADVQSSSHVVNAVSAETQTNELHAGILYGGYGLSSIESRDGHLYFVEKTGAEHGPKSWVALTSCIEDKEGCGKCRRTARA